MEGETQNLSEKRKSARNRSEQAALDDRRIEAEYGQSVYEILAFESASGRHTRAEVAKDLGLTPAQLDSRLRKMGATWKKRPPSLGHGARIFVQDRGDIRPLSEWCVSNQIPKPTGYRWLSENRFKVIEEQDDGGRVVAPTARIPRQGEHRASSASVAR